jgi:hypothetical protein
MGDKTSSRRLFLQSAGVASTIMIAGCSGDDSSMGSSDDCSISQSGDEVEPVSVTFDGRLDSATVELDLRWTARTQNDASRISPSAEDEKYVFFMFEIENTSDTTVPIIHTGGYYLFMLDFETPDTTGEEIPTQVPGAEQLMSETVDLKPGGTFASQVIFSVSDDVTQATVKLSENPYVADATRDSEEIPGFNPECDESISSNLTGGGETAEDSSEETTENGGSDDGNGGNGGNGESDNNNEESRIEELEEEYPNYAFIDGQTYVVILRQLNASADSFSVTISGTAVNGSESDYDYVQIEMGLYNGPNGTGAKVGTALANISGLESGQRWQFEAFGSAEDASSFDIDDITAY